MKGSIFNGARFTIRLLYSIPRGVRRLWRTLLVWGRVLGVYHNSGIQGVNRLARGHGGLKESLRRKDLQEQDKFPPQHPWY